MNSGGSWSAFPGDAAYPIVEKKKNSGFIQLSPAFPRAMEPSRMSKIEGWPLMQVPARESANPLSL